MLIVVYCPRLSRFTLLTLFVLGRFCATFTTQIKIGHTTQFPNIVKKIRVSPKWGSIRRKVHAKTIVLKGTSVVVPPISSISIILILNAEEYLIKVNSVQGSLKTPSRYFFKHNLHV